VKSLGPGQANLPVHGARVAGFGLPELDGAAYISR